MTFPGLAPGVVVGYQIRRASNDTVVQGRTITGVAERPAGLGNYVVIGASPAEQGTYLVIVDWNDGNLDPAHTAIQELIVVSSVAVESSGLGLVADAAKAHLAQTFDRLADDDHYGSAFIARAVAVVKRRVMLNPPTVGDENMLDELVIDYLGKLVALELMPAAVDYWAVQYQSESTGNDPTETASYPDRLKALEMLENELLKQVRRDEAMIVPLINGQRLRAASDGPSIDEDDDFRVTDDPRSHPPVHTIQRGHRRWPSGVHIG